MNQKTTCVLCLAGDQPKAAPDGSLIHVIPLENQSPWEVCADSPVKPAGIHVAPSAAAER